MGVVQAAIDTLKDLPISDVLRERLSLALDETASLERKVSDLQAQAAEFRAEARIAKANEAEAKAQLERLRKGHEEEVRLVKGVEFRRGTRTGNQWMMFCPLCHTPVYGDHHELNSIMCSNGKCNWSSGFTYAIVPQLLPQLG